MNSSISFEDEQGILFDVEGETDDYICHIWKDTNEWFCNCPSFFFRKQPCKHIKECKEVLKNERN